MKNRKKIRIHIILHTSTNDMVTMLTFMFHKDHVTCFLFSLFSSYKHLVKDTYQMEWDTFVPNNTSFLKKCYTYILKTEPQMKMPII